MDVLHDRLIGQVRSRGHAFLPQGRITERCLPLTRSAPLRTPWGAPRPSSRPIHRSAWKVNSANFAYHDFCELRLYGVLRSCAKNSFGIHCPPLRWRLVGTYAILRSTGLSIRRHRFIPEASGLEEDAADSTLHGGCRNRFSPEDLPGIVKPSCVTL